MWRATWCRPAWSPAKPEVEPGCYILIGNGGGNSACMIHNPNCDFNDEITPVGAGDWVKLAESLLPA
ncbi:MAG TPA: hypothetical protein VFZ51_02265 [Woeseiaceae bacterium]